tara:strand:- start:44 stop:724 length:681 start_codon:yes stop_codon:yes gene_type:complete
MTDTGEERESESTHLGEPVEEVQISEEAQQIAEEAAAESAAENESQTESEPDEPVEEAVPEDDAADLKDKLLRALADLENTRRRAAREVADTRKYAASGLAKELLNVSDNLGRALETVTEEMRDGDAGVKNLVLGIEMVEKEMLSAFERQGITRLDPLGEPFDHNFHQAMYEKEDTGYPAGTVAEVMQSGYVIHDRLLRPAMVAVSKGGGAPEESPSEVDPVDTTA